MAGMTGGTSGAGRSGGAGRAALGAEGEGRWRGSRHAYGDAAVDVILGASLRLSRAVEFPAPSLTR